MWWLAISLFLICIIEKNDIENPANFSWFTIFNISVCTIIYFVEETSFKL